MIRCSTEQRDHVLIDGVSKSYDGTSFVVEDLHLRVPKGEFITLLGPSGSGKTTTLMMLAGFEYPTSGRIILDGRSIESTPPEKRNIGMVFQNYALFPHMTVAENVGYSLRVRRLPRAEIDKRVAEALAGVQLAGLAQRKPAALSGGQQQRVALARALVFQPSLVLMDEPLGALDKKLREELQLEIRAIADRFDLTVVYVTHDQQEAMTISDRVAIFNEGRIQQIGSAEDIYSRPTTSFVAAFVGDNNCLDATVIAKDHEHVQARLAGGAVVTARAAGAVEIGKPTTIAVRPEAISLLGEAQPDALSGQISDVIYTGDQIRIHVKLPGGERLVTKRSTSSKNVPAQVGMPVHLRWNQSDAWALDGRQTSQTM